MRPAPGPRNRARPLDTLDRRLSFHQVQGELFRVLLHDDDTTPRPMVVEMLGELFGFTTGQAAAAVTTVERHGVAELVRLPLRQALRAVRLVHGFGSARGLPLDASISAVHPLAPALVVGRATP